MQYLREVNDNSCMFSLPSPQAGPHEHVVSSHHKKWLPFAWQVWLLVSLHVCYDIKHNMLTSNAALVDWYIPYKLHIIRLL